MVCSPPPTLLPEPSVFGFMPEADPYTSALADQAEQARKSSESAHTKSSEEHKKLPPRDHVQRSEKLGTKPKAKELGTKPKMTWKKCVHELHEKQKADPDAFPELGTQPEPKRKPKFGCGKKRRHEQVKSRKEAGPLRLPLPPNQLLVDSEDPPDEQNSRSDCTTAKKSRPGGVKNVDGHGPPDEASQDSPRRNGGPCGGKFFSREKICGKLSPKIDRGHDSLLSPDDFPVFRQRQ